MHLNSSPDHPTAVVQSAPSPSAVRQILLNVINADRAKHHLAALALNTQESRCSRVHSKHMAQIGQLAHDQFPSDICVTHRFAGENIGDSSGDPSQAVLTIHQSMLNEGPCPSNPCSGAAFMAHGHYVNLMNPQYKQVGIGLYVKNGQTWITEDFID